MTPVSFFYAHAGYSYRPDTETPSQGRRRCARELARAERLGSAAGLSFTWSYDPDIDSSDFDDSADPWPLWQCECFNEDGGMAAYLGGIDLGRDGIPHGDPYRRVVEAELAMEALA